MYTLEAEVQEGIEEKFFSICCFLVFLINELTLCMYFESAFRPYLNLFKNPLSFLPEHSLKIASAAIFTVLDLTE